MKDDKFDFYKEVYFFEHNRKNSILSAHSIPVGILSILVGVVAFYLNDGLFSFNETYWPLLLIFFLLLLLSIFKIIKAFIILVKSYTGNPYEHLATMDKVYDYERKNSEYRKDNPVLADQEFFDHLKKNLALAAAKNHKMNAHRSKSLFIVNRNLIWATIWMALSAVPYFIRKGLIDRKEEVQKIKIVNFTSALSNKINTTMAEDNNNGGTELPKDTAEPIQPVFPSNETIIEGNDPYVGGGESLDIPDIGSSDLETRDLD